MILLLGILAGLYVLAVAVGFYSVNTALDHELVADFIPEGWDDE